MKKALLAFAAILAIAAGCAKENFKTMISHISGNKVTGITRISTEILDSDARATLDISNPDCYKQVWEADDCIAVTDTVSRAVKFNYVGEDGSSVGDFEAEEGQEPLTDTAINRYAVYPYASFKAIALDKASDVVTVIYPAQQTFDFFTNKAEGNNLMLAHCKFVKGSSDSTFYFKNICAYMQLNVVPGASGDQIRAIIIKSLNGSVINGRADVTVDAKTGEISSIEFDERYGNSSSVIACYDDDNEGLDITGEPIFVALPPIIGGFSVTVVTCDGLSMTKESSTDLEIGTFVTMPEFEFSGIEPTVEIPEEGETYLSFKAALEVANTSGSNCTIKLLSDCYITAPAEFDNSALDSITIDLNGQKLYEAGINRINVCDGTTVVITDNTANGGEIIQESADSDAIESYGTVNLRSGKISAGQAAVKVCNGSFEMTGGEIECTNYDANGAVEINVDKELSLSGVELKGGKITSTSRGLYAKYYDTGDLVQLHDGIKIISDRATICGSTSGNILIDGGDYESTTTNVVYTTGNNPAISITGGWFYTTFATPLSGKITVSGISYFNQTKNLYEKVADGYMVGRCEEEHEGKLYTVMVKPASFYEAVSTDDNGTEIMRGKLNDVLENAASNESTAYKNVTITLLDDAQCSSAVAFSTPERTVTLNLNGKTMVSTGNKDHIITVKDGTFIIQSTDENGTVLPEGTMAQIITNSYIISQQGGELTVKSGKLIHTSESSEYTIYSTGGNLNIEGGYIESDHYRTIWKSNGKITMTGGEVVTYALDSLPYPQAIYLTTNGVAELTGGKTTGIFVYASSTGGCTGCTIDGIKTGYVGNYGMNNADNVLTITNIPYTASDSLIIDVIRAASTTEIAGGTYGKVICRSHINSGTVNVNGGTFNGTINVESAGTTLNLNGGTFNETINVDGGTANLNSGTFTHLDGKPAVNAVSGTANINEVSLSASNLYGTVRAAGGTVNVNKGAQIAATGDNRALYVGDNTNANVEGSKINVKGGDITSENRTIHMYSGTLNIEGGKFSTTSSSQPILYCNGTKGRNSLSITGGYFAVASGVNAISNGETGTDILGSVTGGHYTSAFDESIVNETMEITDTAPVVEGGITYTYSIRTKQGIPDVIKVNGKGYKSFETAIAAARISDENVEMQLIDSIKVDGAVDFTNNNGKEVTLDLNGFNFTGKTNKSHFITTTGTLNITDNSGKTPGTVWSNGYRVISLGAKGTVNIKKVKVTTSRTSSNWAGADSSVVVICGTGTKANSGTINISDNARVESNGSVKVFYVGYGNLSIENAEVYCAKYHCFYFYTGAKVELKSGAKLRSDNNKTVLRFGTNNANGQVNISDGVYIYGAPFETSQSSYASVLFLDGGYFSQDFSNIANYSTINFKNGKTLQKEDATCTMNGETLYFTHHIK